MAASLNVLLLTAGASGDPELAERLAAAGCHVDVHAVTRDAGGNDVLLVDLQDADVDEVWMPEGLALTAKERRGVERFHARGGGMVTIGGEGVVEDRYAEGNDGTGRAVTLASADAVEDVQPLVAWLAPRDKRGAHPQTGV